MNNPSLNMPALAALDADELRVMITSVNKLTNQMAVLTDYFERAGSRLHQRHTEDLDKAVERILREGYGQEEAGSIELELAMPVLRAVGAEVFVKKLLWGGEEDDLTLACAMAKVIPQFECLVQEHPFLLLSQAADCLAAIRNFRLPGTPNDGLTA